MTSVPFQQPRPGGGASHGAVDVTTLAQCGGERVMRSGRPRRHLGLRLERRVLLCCSRNAAIVSGLAVGSEAGGRVALEWLFSNEVITNDRT